MPQGAGSTCADNDGNSIADVCETAVCDVAPDDLSCLQVDCPGPLPPIEECAPQEVIIDNQTGQVIQVLSCDCLEVGVCGISIDPFTGIATCTGGCPAADLFCKSVVTDLGNGTSTLDCECRPSTCTCGDLNQSGGNVNLADFAVLANCFNLNNPNPPTCPAKEFACADLNGSGNIDLGDAAQFFLYFNATTTKTPPNCAGGP